MLSKKIINAIIRNSGLDFGEVNDKVMNPKFDTEPLCFIPMPIRERWEELEFDHKVLLWITADKIQIGL